MIFNRETNPTIIIRRKTKMLQSRLQRPELRSCFDTAQLSQGKHIDRLRRGLTTPLQLLFRSPIVSLIALYIATVYGCLYLLFTTITDVFQNTYGWSLQISGLSYIGLGLGFLSGQCLFGLVSDKIILRLRKRNRGVLQPEMRLPLSIFYAFFVPISFFWYGWSIKARTHWIVPIIGLFPFAFGMVGIFATLQTYVVDTYPRYAASGIAAITISRSLFGALLPLAGPYMYQSLGYGWGNSLLGFVTLAMIPMPVLFYRFGERLRRKATLNLS